MGLCIEETGILEQFFPVSDPPLQGFGLFLPQVGVHICWKAVRSWPQSLFCWFQSGSRVSGMCLVLTLSPFCQCVPMYLDKISFHSFYFKICIYLSNPYTLCGTQTHDPWRSTDTCSSKPARRPSLHNLLNSFYIITATSSFSSSPNLQLLRIVSP